MALKMYGKYNNAEEKEYDKGARQAKAKTKALEKMKKDKLPYGKVSVQGSKPMRMMLS